MDVLVLILSFCVASLALVFKIAKTLNKGGKRKPKKLEVFYEEKDDHQAHTKKLMIVIH